MARPVEFRPLPEIRSQVSIVRIAVDNADPKKRSTPVFDFVVLLGMVVNLILAIFLILYYFDLF